MDEGQRFLRELWEQMLEALTLGDRELTDTLTYKWMAVSRRVVR